MLITAVTIWKFEAGFWLALVAALMHGTAAAFSESTVLGFMKGFPSRLVAPFSTGTGFAGIFGSGILLILKLFFQKDGYIFAIVSPIILIYLFCIFWLQRMKSKYKFNQELDAITPKSNNRGLGNDTLDPFISPMSKTLSGKVSSAKIEQRHEHLEDQYLNDEVVLEYDAPDDTNSNAYNINADRNSIQNLDRRNDDNGNNDSDEAAENEAFSCTAFRRVLKHVGIYLFSLSFIYFFEYTILTCFADVYSKRK